MLGGHSDHRRRTSCSRADPGRSGTPRSQERQEATDTKHQHGPRDSRPRHWRKRALGAVATSGETQFERGIPGTVESPISPQLTPDSGMLVNNPAPKTRGGDSTRVPVRHCTRSLTSYTQVLTGACSSEPSIRSASRTGNRTSRNVFPRRIHRGRLLFMVGSEDIVPKLSAHRRTGSSARRLPQAFAEENLSNAALVEALECAARFESSMAMPRLRLRFVARGRGVEEGETLATEVVLRQTRGALCRCPAPGTPGPRG